MTSDLDKILIGDSARNNRGDVFKMKVSNHIFDGAGENIQYHSDCESRSSTKSKTRYINPAICIETVEASHSEVSLQMDAAVEDHTPHPHTTYRSSSTPFLTSRISNVSVSSGSVKRKQCRLQDMRSNSDDESSSCNGETYRDGADTFRLSVASVSTTVTAREERERNERKKQEAFREWLARKDQEKREKEKSEKMKEQAIQRPTLEQREESYRRWLEQKRTKNERQRAEEIMRRYRENERLERERNKRELEKQEKLADWIKKKEEEMKAMKTREERRATRVAIEEERRRVNGERAYRDWLRTSKNKPLPVPLNQGELSMRGSISQMYINPVPWQSSV